MAEFAESLKCLSSPLPFIEMDQSFELMSHLPGLSGSFIENPGPGLACFSNDSCFSPQPNLVLHFVDNLQPPEHPKPMNSTGQQSSGDEKRKAIATQETNTGNSSATHSESTVGKDTAKKRNSSGSRKRRRSDSKGAQEPKEVAHVRARRGQATDSHSLAERVRRERINERMRCLKGLVPGCDKVMGMTGMLDEIINYVQSLQNQVEFLSMELTAASSFHDFSLGNGAITPQVMSRGDKEQNLPLNKLEDNTIVEIASSIGFSLPSEVEGAKSLLAYIRELERSRAPKS